MLGRVLERVRTCGLPAYVAFPPADLPEWDVLSRMVRVAQQLPDVDTFVRVTADCPLLDPGVVGYVCNVFREGRWDFVGTAPEMDGTDVEVFTRTGLMLADLHARGAEREHVTPWMRAHLGARVVNLAPEPLRWSVDDEPGLEFARAVFRACGLCARGVPHHTNSASGIGGADRHLCVDLHQVEDGGLAECLAGDLKQARMGTAWKYVSPSGSKNAGI